MSKGSISPPERSESRDPLSGRRVVQLTNHPSINHPTYFLQSSFTRDGAGVIFTSYRTGSAQLFLAAWPSGDLRQLTAAATIHPYSPALHGDGKHVYFVRGGEVWELSLRSLAERQVASFAGGQLGEVSLSPDGEWITAAIKQGAQAGLAVGRRDGTGWSLIPFPRTVIHPQFHPLDPEWIEFAGDPAPRIHRVRRDGTGLECLYQHGNDEFVVHETFLAQTGDLVYTMWPFKLCRLGWDSRVVTQIAAVNAWHIAPNRSGTKILYDTNHPYRGLQLLDVATGREEFLCTSAATNQGTQWRKSRYALAEDFAAARDALPTGALSWMESGTDTVYGPNGPTRTRRSRLMKAKLPSRVTAPAIRRCTLRKCCRLCSLGVNDTVLTSW